MCACSALNIFYDQFHWPKKSHLRLSMPRWDSFCFWNVLLDLYAESVEGLAITLNEELAIAQYLCVFYLVTLSVDNA